MKNPLVVGYKGEIGSFILNGLLRHMPKALNIHCVDIHETVKEVTERIKKSDYIFLCVPILLTLRWISQYKRFLQGKIIVEQCSLKEWIYESPIIKGLDIRSMHILFRPSATPDPKDHRVALIHGQFDPDTIVPDLAKITSSVPIYFHSVEKHDEQMALEQAFVHRFILVMGDLLNYYGCSTYMSNKVLDLSKRITAGDRVLYGMIQTNKHLQPYLEQMEKKLCNFNINRYFS